MSGNGPELSGRRLLSAPAFATKQASSNTTALVSGNDPELSGRRLLSAPAFATKQASSNTTALVPPTDSEKDAVHDELRDLP